MIVITLAMGVVSMAVLVVVIMVAMGVVKSMKPMMTERTVTPIAMVRITATLLLIFSLMMMVIM